MRYIRVCYMCPKCNDMKFFNKEDEFSTICADCNVEMVCVEEKYTSTEEDERRERLKNSNVSNPTVKCPYCNSVNTQKISTASKAGSVVLFGIFAIGKTSKQWHCNSCGADF